MATNRKKPIWYIQRRGQGRLETVDQFDNRPEARKMLTEYTMSDPPSQGAHYYISSRPCKAWLAD